MSSVVCAYFVRVVKRALSTSGKREVEHESAQEGGREGDQEVGHQVGQSASLGSQVRGFYEAAVSKICEFTRPTNVRAHVETLFMVSKSSLLQNVATTLWAHFPVCQRFAHHSFFVQSLRCA